MLHSEPTSPQSSDAPVRRLQPTPASRRLPEQPRHWLGAALSAAAHAVVTAIEWRMSHELADLRRRYHRP